MPDPEHKGTDGPQPKPTKEQEDASRAPFRRWPGLDPKGQKHGHHKPRDDDA